MGYGGSCAQIGKNVHLSGGPALAGARTIAGIPSLLKMIIIGARSEVVEGVVVERGQCYPWVCLLAHQQRLFIVKQVKYLWVVPIRCCAGLYAGQSVTRWNAGA